MDFKKITSTNDLRTYLNAPFSNSTWDKAFHYTSLYNLFLICEKHTLLFSTLKRMNDFLELKFAPTCEDYFMSFTTGKGTEFENFGMWAMYGHIKDVIDSNESLEVQSKKIGVKLGFQNNALENLVHNTRGLSAHFVAYTDLIFRKNKKIKFRSSENKNGITLDNSLSGFIKDNSWSYENELRLCLNKEFATDNGDGSAYIKVDDSFLKEIQVYPSPLYKDYHECESIFEKLWGTKNSPVTFHNNNYKGLYNAIKK